MSVLKYFKNTPWSSPHRATDPKCNFFSSNLQRGPCKKKGAVAPQRATAPPFFLQGLRCKFEEKKLHFGPVALWEGDRGIFLKYFKTDIYF